MRRFTSVLRRRSALRILLVLITVDIAPGEVPVFWPCGVTPQNVLTEARLPFAITHAPGHMLITDIKNSQLKD